MSGIVADALTGAGVAHRVNTAGNLFSVFFTDREVVDYATRQAAGRGGVHGVLPRDARPRRLPAAVGVRGVVRRREPRRRRAASASPTPLPHAARAAAAGKRPAAAT